MRYNRKAVYDYAKEWAYARNPKYYNYDSIGGDCTNFASQCVFAGCKEMNYNKNNGWYYIDGNNKSPSWTATEYLYKFLTTNKGAGPSGDVVQINELDIGDIVQLNFNGNVFSHSLVVVQSGTTLNNTLIAAHTNDVFGKRVSGYNFYKYRCIHITF